MAGHKDRPFDYYFGATGGGLWKTTDGGATRYLVTDGQIRSSSVGAVAVAESNPDIVCLGMGESELRQNVLQGDGVYKLTDGGQTWEHIGLEERAQEYSSRSTAAKHAPDQGILPGLRRAFSRTDIAIAGTRATPPGIPTTHE